MTAPRVPDAAWIRPPAVGPGAVLGVAAPSGPVDPVRLANGLRILRAAGFEIALAPGLLERDGFLAGDDGGRARDLGRLLRDPGVDAVLCARGGYGAMRLLPGLDLRALRARPKAFVGFSDVTAIHLAFAAEGLVSFHGPVVECGAGPEAEENLRAMAAALGGVGPRALAPAADPTGGRALRTLGAGRATGRLLGGNLSLLAATVGTPWEVPADGAVLFLEEVGEPAYRLDRYLTQLWLAGKLQAAAGFVVGDLAGCCQGPHEPDAVELLAERLLPLGKPCLAHLPLGHGARNGTIPLGVRVELDAGARTLTFMEPAVDVAGRRAGPAGPGPSGRPSAAVPPDR